jgi:hypothetical protein
MGVSSNGGTPKWMVYNGKSQFLFCGSWGPRPSLGHLQSSPFVSWGDYSLPDQELPEMVGILSAYQSPVAYGANHMWPFHWRFRDPKWQVFIFLGIGLAPHGYGSIPINTIFRGMNIHLPAILMFTRGTRFWHTATWSCFLGTWGSHIYCL